MVNVIVGSFYEKKNPKRVVLSSIGESTTLIFPPFDR